MLWISVGISVLKITFDYKDDCSIFQAELFAILKAIKFVTSRATSDSEFFYDLR